MLLSPSETSVRAEEDPTSRKARPAAHWRREKAPKQHVEDVTTQNHAYQIDVGGTLDEFNTAYYPETYGGSMRLDSKFQPNFYVALENVGETDVVNPSLLVNGRHDWYSADNILAGIVRPEMTDAEKAMAIWCFTASFEVQAHDNNRRVGPAYPAVGSETDNDETSHPSRNTFKERANPVKAANCYYCSGCSLSTANFVVLCRHAGLTSRAVWMSPLDTFRNHCVGEVWYEGGWHLFDPECRTFFLARDNTTIASYRMIHEDPVLEARTHYGGFASKGMQPHGHFYKKYYPPHTMPVEQWLSTMDMTLRPGEVFVWRWAHDGKYRYGNNVRKRIQHVPYHLANGKFIYQPPLGGLAYQRGIVSDHNITSVKRERQDPILHPKVVRSSGYEDEVIASPSGFVIYKVTSPYPIVGGLVRGTFFCKSTLDRCRIWVSVHDSDWTGVWLADGTGQIEAHVPVDEIMAPKATPAIYEYYVKFELRAATAPADVQLTGVVIETDVQMAATALPSLSVGLNQVVYHDESGRDRRVRITHGWRESSATRPPSPPIQPVSPHDGEEIDLSSLATVSWEPALDPEGQAIADHHIQVSPRPDMLHPVSPNLNRLSRSGDAEWALPRGWLVKGRTYYWRVRARDQWGGWSDWSKVWKFKTKR